ncbi:MAG: YwbE family protein [Patescibacteria group bacterium]|nr:YwbE family protein [Patescibacteria group bacterium]
MTRGIDNPTPPRRSEIKPGDAVWIIEKKHYGTNNYTQGIVKEILTSKNVHPRGVKVRLTDGTVGRVQWKITD